MNIEEPINELKLLMKIGEFDKLVRFATHLTNPIENLWNLRNTYKLVAYAGKLISSRMVQIDASILVMRIERLVHKHLPAKTPQESGALKGKKQKEPQVAVSPSIVRQIRRAHTGIDDIRFEQVVQYHRKHCLTMNRKRLTKYASVIREREAIDEC